MESGQRIPGNYLVFDGGQSAMSGLLIMEEICVRIQFDQERDKEVRVCDHCDLLGGSGTGAVAAIMLGRMGLKTSQAIEAYLKLESVLSVQPTKDEGERRWNTEAFKAAFTEVLLEAGFTVDTPMMDKTAPKTVIWTLNTANLSVPQPIRSYRVHSSSGPSCTILEAACASIASPDRFLPVTLGSSHEKVTLIDAMPGYPNPTKELLKEAQGVFGDDAEVASIVSLGAGKEYILNISRITDPDALVDVLSRAALDSQRTHEEVHGRLNRLLIYSRFNVEYGIERQCEASAVYERITAYMMEASINELLDNAVKNIEFRPKGITLMEINTESAVEITLKPRPSLVQNFVGRKDILNGMIKAHIDNRLPEPGLPVITVLMGLGGSGKTQTALKFALDYEERYRDAAVYFFNASSEAKLMADFELAIRARDSVSRSKSHNDALFWFANRSDPWLIIMDNADDPALELFHFIPKSSQGNVIITTRNAAHKKLAPTSSHHVGALSPADASTLILEGSRYPDNNENRAYAQLISKELGYLPLALANATGYIFVHRCLSTYLNTYHERRAKLLATKPSLPEDHSLSVATKIETYATLDLCYESLPPSSQQFLYLTSFFYHSEIPLTMFAYAVQNGLSDTWKFLDRPGSHTAMMKRLKEFLYPDGRWDESHVQEILHSLQSFSLISTIMVAQEVFLRFHPLVQPWGRDRIKTAEEITLYKQMVCCIITSCVDQRNPTLYPTLHLCLIKLIEESNISDMHVNDQIAFGIVCLATGDLKNAEQLIRQAHITTMGIMGKDHPHTLDAYDWLANVYRQQGRWAEAEAMKEDILFQRRKLYGDDDPETIKVAITVADLYKAQEKWSDAEKLEVKVLEQMQRLHGSDHPDTIAATAALAVTYRKQDRLEDTEKMEAEVFEHRQKYMGEEHPDSVQAAESLVDTCIRQKKWTAAERPQLAVLRARRNTLGRGHRQTIVAATKLADIYIRQGRWKEAETLQAEIAEANEVVLGSDHMDTVLASEKLSILQDAGDSCIIV